MEQFNKPIQRVMREMEVGDVVSYPIERLFVVRVSASDIGLILGRKYTTKCCRNEGVIRVKRTK